MSLVIATTMSPSFTDILPTTTISVTGTVTGRPTPTPSPANLNCGVHGQALGDFYIGTFYENKDNVPVTLEGCYQFCRLNGQQGTGCLSYHFYEQAGLAGSARCDIFGQATYNVIRYLDNSQGVWYDLGCGDPVDPTN